MPRAGLLLLVVGVLAASGCLSSSDHAAPGPVSLQFQDNQRTPGEQVAAEPNFAVGPKGLFLIAPGSLVTQPNVADSQVSLWGSAPMGGDWSPLRTPSPRDANGTFCSCDADVVVDVDGTVYITDFWVTGAPRNLPSIPGGLPVGTPTGFVVQSSSDEGKTWSRGQFLVAQPFGPNDRQYLVAGTQAGEVYLAYSGGLAPPLPATPPVGGGGMQLWRSTDHGATFTPLPAVETDGSRSAMIAHPRIGPDGTFYYPWLDTSATDPWNGTASAIVAVSHDHGQTFQRHTIAELPDGPGGLWPLQVDVGTDGQLVAVWMERVPSGGSNLFVSTSDDQGAIWGPPVHVASGTALLPWVTWAGHDRVAVAYYGAPEAVYALGAPADQRWDAWVVTMDHGAVAPPVRVSPFPVKVGTFCPQGAACPADRELLDYPAIVWSGGWVQVAYSVSLLDAGAGPPPSTGPEGAHATAGHLWTARAHWPLP